MKKKPPVAKLSPYFYIFAGLHALSGLGIMIVGIAINHNTLVLIGAFFVMCTTVWGALGLLSAIYEEDARFR